MTKNENRKTAYDNQEDKFAEKKPFNNVPPKKDQVLAPILITEEIRQDPQLIRDNMETWNIRGFRIPVAFAPVERSHFTEWMHFFWGQVRAYMISGGKTDLAPELGHGNDYSYDQFLEDTDSDDVKGFIPVSDQSEEDTLIVTQALNDLIQDVSQISPKYSRIIDLLWKDRTKKEIIEELDLGKSQGYDDIKAAQRLARKIYEKY